MSSMYMKASEIRFAQNNIKGTFSEGIHSGEDVHEIIDEIYRGETSAKDFLPISVALYEGHWYTGNNRSLYVFRVLEYNGQVNEIPVKRVNANRIWRLMSTKNEGASVTMRNGAPTRPHSIQQIHDKRKTSVAKSDNGSGWDTAWKVGAGLLAEGAAVGVANAARNARVNANTIWRSMLTKNEGASVTMRNGVPTRPRSIQQIRDKRKTSAAKSDNANGSGWDTAWKVGAGLLAVGVANAARNARENDRDTNKRQEERPGQEGDCVIQ